MQAIRNKITLVLKSTMILLQPQTAQDPVLIHLQPRTTHPAPQQATQANLPLQAHVEASDRLLQRRYSRPDPVWRKLHPVWLKIPLHTLYKDQRLDHKVVSPKPKFLQMEQYDMQIILLQVNHQILMKLLWIPNGNMLCKKKSMH
jgi:hypothetical protein